MIEVLNWASEHYVLATIFMLIAGATVVETAHAFRRRK